MTNNYDLKNTIMKTWVKQSIAEFFSDEKQERLVRILEGLNKVTNAHKDENGNPPSEEFYNELLTEIFPKKPETAMRLWRSMNLEEKFGFLKASSAVTILYKQAWNKYPAFIPEKLLRILHAIMR